MSDTSQTGTPALAVGDTVRCVEWTGRVVGEPRVIVRETETQWITADGLRWKKAGGYLTPKYLDTYRRIERVTP